MEIKIGGAMEDIIFSGYDINQPSSFGYTCPSCGVWVGPDDDHQCQYQYWEKQPDAYQLTCFGAGWGLSDRQVLDVMAANLEGLRRQIMTLEALALIVLTGFSLGWIVSRFMGRRKHG